MLQEVAELGQFESVRATDETRKFVRRCINCMDEEADEN